MKAVLVTILLVGIVRSEKHEAEPTEESLKRGLSHKCGAREPSSCIAIELVGYVDRMLRTASIQLSDDVMIVDESNGAAAEAPVKSETLARAGTSLEDQAQQLIMDKLWNFATTRSLRYRLLDNADLVVSGAQEKDGSFGVGVALKSPKVFESGRSRNKNMGPFLAAAAMKFGLLGALTFKGLTLMVGKALLISKIALLLATIIGLKKLFSPQTRSVTYEIFTDSHHHWRSWKRSLDGVIHTYDSHNFTS